MKRKAEVVWASVLAVLAGLGVIAGCVGSRTGPASQPAASGGGPGGDVSTGDAGAASLELSGSQLWALNCAKCHNNRSPSDYSDAQWETAVLHMRIQARLTGEEERKILQFLKASN